MSVAKSKSGHSKGRADSGNSDDASTPNACKLFIGGLSYDTTDTSLQRYFEEYGEVDSAVVLRDPTTLRSRGFGFVTFTNYSSASEVVAFTRHLIDGRKVEAKFAVPRAATTPTNSNSSSNNNNNSIPASPSSSSSSGIVVGGQPNGKGVRSNSTGSSNSSRKGSISCKSPTSPSMRSSSATSFSSTSTAASLQYSAAVTGGITPSPTSATTNSSNGGTAPTISFAAIAKKDLKVEIDNNNDVSSNNNNRNSNSGSNSYSYNIRNDEVPPINPVEIDRKISFAGSSGSFDSTCSIDSSSIIRKKRTTSKNSTSSLGGGIDEGVEECEDNIQINPPTTPGGGIISNKIFVGGLLYATGHESLRNFFEVYGPVDTAEVIYNRDTKKSRGFGFVVFKEHESVNSVLNEQNKEMHVIDGKQVEVKRCVARQEGSTTPTASSSSSFSTTPKGSSPRHNKKKSLVVEEEEKDQQLMNHHQNQSTVSGGSGVSNQWTKNISFAAIAATGTKHEQSQSSSSTTTTTNDDSISRNNHNNNSSDHHEDEKQQDTENRMNDIKRKSSHPQLHIDSNAPMINSYEYDHNQHPSSTIGAQIRGQDEFFFEDQYQTDQYYEEELQNYRNERTSSSASSSSFLGNFVSPSSPQSQQIQSPFQQSAFSPRSTADEPPQVSYMPSLAASPVGSLTSRGSPLPHLPLDGFHQNVIGSPRLRSGSPLGDGSSIWGNGGISSPATTPKNNPTDQQQQQHHSSPQLVGRATSASFQHSLGHISEYDSTDVYMKRSASIGAESASFSNLSINSPTYHQQQQHHHHHQQQQQQQYSSPLHSPVQLDTLQQHNHNRVHHHQKQQQHNMHHGLASPMSTSSAPATVNNHFGQAAPSPRQDFSMFTMNFAPRQQSNSYYESESSS